LNGNFNSALQSLGLTSTNPIFSTGAQALTAGDTLDFVVGNAGSYFFDSTPLAVQIAQQLSPGDRVPESATLLLVMAGLFAIGIGARRKGATSI